MTRALASLVLLSLILLSGGCAATVIPPPRPADPATVFLTDYGRHSSLILPGASEHYVEYAFGDWDWFALGHKDSGNAAHAMLMSDASALGRREITLPPYANDDAVKHITGAKRVQHVVVSRQRVQALLAELDDLHRAHLDTVTYNPKTHLWFVKYEGGYHLLHNCNHVTADWLRALNCQVRGNAMLSRFRVKA